MNRCHKSKKQDTPQNPSEHLVGECDSLEVSRPPFDAAIYRSWLKLYPNSRNCVRWRQNLDWFAAHPEAQGRGEFCECS